MFKKTLLAGLAMGAVLIAPSAAQALTITFIGGVGGLPGGHTLHEDFTTFASGPNHGVYNANVPNFAFRPQYGLGDSYFLAVFSGGSLNFSFGPLAELSFDLGSLDNYNRLILHFADSTTMALLGGEIIGQAAALPNSGDTTSTANNGRVTYMAAGGPDIVGMTLESEANSFEIDQISFLQVPEPETWLMTILGFGAVAMMMRRRGQQRGRIAFN